MSDELEKRLQPLDVGVVDVLSHLEALVRHNHSIERDLLRLRTAALPLPVRMSEDVSAAFTGHLDEMHREWAMLGDILRDFRAGLRGLNGESDVSERRSGLDRRCAEAVRL